MINVLCISVGSIITYISTLYFIYSILKLKYNSNIVLTELKYNETVVPNEEQEEQEDINIDDTLMAALNGIKLSENHNDNEIATAENQGE